MIQVSCPACSKTLQVREEFAGKKARCPSCQDVLSIPSLQIQPAGGPPPLPGASVSNDFEEVMPIDGPPLGGRRSVRVRDDEEDYEPAGGGSRRGLWLGIGIPVVLLVLGGAGWGIYALVSDKKDDKVADSGSSGTVKPEDNGGLPIRPGDNGNAGQGGEPLNPAVAQVQDQLVGKWKEKGFGLIFEFNRDGTYSNPGGPGGRGASKGTYKIIDEKTLEMTDSGGMSKRMAMTLTADKLELTTSAQLTNVKGTEADKLKGTSMDFTLSFVRADAASTAPTGVAQGNPNGGNVIPPLPVPKPTEPPKPTGNVKELLPGRFIAKNQFGGKDEVWVFTADNQFYYEGRDMVHGTFRYVSEDVIDLKPNNFGFTAAYGGERKVEVTEKTLRLSGKVAPGTGNTFERFQGGNTTVVRADTPKPNTPKPNTPKPRPGMEAPPGTPWPQKKSAESGTKLEILEDYSFETREPINRVALSPDGKTLAIAWDRVYLYDVSTNPPLKKADLKSHPFVTRALVFSPNGRFLASAGHDRIMHVWDLSEASPKEIPVPKVHDGGINALAFSPNGNLLASGADDKAIVLWDVSGDKVTERGVLRLPASRVAQGITSLAFSPNGQLLAAAGHGVWQVWDVNKRIAARGNQIRNVRHHEMPIAYSPDGKIMVMAADSVIHYVNGGQTGILVGHGERITALSFSPDGRTLASVGEDGKMILWDVPALKRREIKERPGKLTSVAFSPIQTEALKSADQLLAVGNHNNSFTMLHLGYPEK
jgi:hypothetical protein